MDGATNSPLFYTRVSLMENDSSTNELYMSFTGADGQFAVEKVSAGDYVLKAVLVGYDFLSLPLHSRSSTTAPMAASARATANAAWAAELIHMIRKPT